MWSATVVFKNSVRTAKKTQLFNKDQLVNAVQGNNCCLQWESYETDEYKMKS
jgi:hypothetical protein